MRAVIVCTAIRPAIDYDFIGRSIFGAFVSDIFSILSHQNILGTDSGERRFVRVVGGARLSGHDPLTIDVVLQNRMIVAGKPYFGFRGTLSGDLLPFILFSDGSIDYGSGYEERDRHGSTNILEKKIELGVLFTTREYDADNGAIREYVYEIKQIVDLALR